MYLWNRTEPQLQDAGGTLTGRRKETHPGQRIDWVICGCESGPKARPFNEDWARTARDACQECDIPFFYKQGPPYMRRGQPTKMPTLDGRVWAQRPN